MVAVGKKMEDVVWLDIPMHETRGVAHGQDHEQFTFRPYRDTQFNLRLFLTPLQVAFALIYTSPTTSGRFAKAFHSAKRLLGRR